jgi:hypothetical protein
MSKPRFTPEICSAMISMRWTRCGTSIWAGNIMGGVDWATSISGVRKIACRTLEQIRRFNHYGFRPLASLSPPLGAYFGRVRHTHQGAKAFHLCPLSLGERDRERVMVRTAHPTQYPAACGGVVLMEAYRS